MEASVVSSLQDLLRIGFGKALILAFEHFGEISVADISLAQGSDNGIGGFVVGVCLARAAVVDAGRPFVFPEPEVDLDDILDVNEVAALLAVVEAVRAAKQSRFARFLELTVELVED